MDGASDLAALVAEPGVYVTAAGERVEVAPLKVRQLPAFARAVAPLLSEMAGRRDGLLDVAALVALHGERLAQAVAVATSRPEAWVGDMEADDFVRLVALVIEVNGDFFVRRLAPALEQAALTIERKLTPTAAPAGSA